MNQLLPYEEQLALQFGDLALPDENVAWADMKRRLEEDDDNKLIPVWLRGCAPWALLIVALLAGGWWLIRPEKWFKKNTGQEKIIDASTDSSTNQSTNTIYLKDSLQTIDQHSKDTLTITRVSKDSAVSVNTSKLEQLQKTGRVIKKEKESIDLNVNPPQIVKRKKTGDKKTETDTSINQLKDKTDPQLDISVINNSPAGKPKTDSAKSTLLKKDKDNNKPIDSVQESVIVRKDSVTSKETPAKPTETIKESKQKRPMVYSAGLAIQQQLPVDGQKWTPYNSVGRKGTLADYIPSIYGRIEKKERWFLQGEFKYGAPQYTPPLRYYQRVDTTVVGQKFNTTSHKLEKTYYHQLPLSFNYFVLPNWSVGTGIVWNKFYSAVSTEDVIERTIATGQDTAISSGTILRLSRADSNFVKSYFQAVFETQYKWKRFSFGARYSFGLQPYIKFRLPGGVQQEEKNSSLQLFLRYELWRSKEK